MPVRPPGRPGPGSAPRAKEDAAALSAARTLASPPGAGTRRQDVSPRRSGDRLCGQPGGAAGHAAQPVPDRRRGHLQLRGDLAVPQAGGPALQRRADDIGVAGSPRDAGGGQQHLRPAARCAARPARPHPGLGAAGHADAAGAGARPRAQHTAAAFLRAAQQPARHRPAGGTGIHDKDHDHSPGAPGQPHRLGPDREGGTRVAACPPGHGARNPVSGVARPGPGATRRTPRSPADPRQPGTPGSVCTLAPHTNPDASKAPVLTASVARPDPDDHRERRVTPVGRRSASGQPPIGHYGRVLRVGDHVIPQSGP